jgi:hypothetical protein
MMSDVPQRIPNRCFGDLSGHHFHAEEKENERTTAQSVALAAQVLRSHEE